MNGDTWPFLFIATMGVLIMVFTGLFAYMALTSLEWNRDNTVETIPAQWAETNRTQTTREITQWLTDNHQDLRRLGADWVQADLSDNVAWQFHPPRPGPDGVNYAKGAATVNITMPDHQYAISAHIPWLLRLQP